MHKETQIAYVSSLNVYVCDSLHRAIYVLPRSRMKF